MTIELGFHVRLTLAGATPIDVPTTVQVDAVDDISIDIADAAADFPVAIQPGPAAKIVVVAISAVSGLAGLTYRASLASAAIPLQGVHSYVGSGMAALLDANPTTLYFSNATGQSQAVRIIVGRMA